MDKGNTNYQQGPASGSPTKFQDAASNPVIQYDPAMTAFVQEAANPIRQSYIHQLLGLAYASTVIKKTFDPYNSSQLEKAYFLKYNRPELAPTAEASSGGAKPLTHLKYIRASPVLSEGPMNAGKPSSLYPRFSTELNFDPQLSFFQRFTQNVYTRPGEPKTEEKEITVKTTGPVAPAELGFSTPQSLISKLLRVSPQSIESYNIFKIPIKKEAFQR